MSGHSKETGDQIISFKDAVLVHQLDEDYKCLATVLAGIPTVVSVDPFTEEELGLLKESRRILEFSGLLDACVIIKKREEKDERNGY